MHIEDAIWRHDGVCGVTIGGCKINWIEFNAARGGTMEPPAVRDFGDPGRELNAARDTAALTPLSHFGVIAVTGPDAAPFLQSQLTSDLRRVAPDTAQFSGYCTPKGRLIATFVIVEHDGGYLLLVPAPLVSSLIGRLRKYLLRSQARLEDASLRYFAVGVCGPQARSAVAGALSDPPAGPWSVSRSRLALAVCLPGPGFVFIAGEAQLPQLWTNLSRAAVPAGAAAWDGGQIRAGIPWLLPATQELFLPQALGLEELGGVGFEKGCYPGQEIVARTHYLGEVKRHLAHGDADQAVVPGQTLKQAGTGESAGTVVNAAPSPDGGWELLAVVQREALSRGELCAADGPVVRLTRGLTAGAVSGTS